MNSTPFVLAVSLIVGVSIVVGHFYEGFNNDEKPDQLGVGCEEYCLEWFNFCWKENQKMFKCLETQMSEFDRRIQLRVCKSFGFCYFGPE